MSLRDGSVSTCTCTWGEVSACRRENSNAATKSVSGRREKGRARSVLTSYDRPAAAGACEIGILYVLRGR